MPPPQAAERYLSLWPLLSPADAEARLPNAAAMTRRLAALLSADALVAAAEHAVAVLTLPSSFSDSPKPPSPAVLAALRRAPLFFPIFAP